jgi:hypothetical protein
MKKRSVKYTALICLFITLFSGAFGQNNPYGKVKGDSLYSTGWSFGLNMGAYFGSKYQANFYNGSSLNIDSMNLVFGNKYYREEIERLYNTDTVVLLELPADMHYQPAMMIGFFVKYNMTTNLGVLLQFNYQKLTAKDVFTMIPGPALNYLTWQDIHVYPIWGKEERMNIDLGISKDFVLGESVHFFAEGGMNINYVKVKEHRIAIEGLDYSLINIYGDQPYVPGMQQQTYNVHIGGWGMGAFLNAGFRLIFNNRVSLDPGAAFYWSQIKLKGYTAFKPHFAAYVRLSYQNLITKEKFRGR